MMIKIRTWLHQLTYLAQDNATAMAIFNAKYFIPSDHPMARLDSGWHCKGQCFEKEEPRGFLVEMLRIQVRPNIDESGELKPSNLHSISLHGFDMTAL